MKPNHVWRMTLGLMIVFIFLSLMSYQAKAEPTNPRYKPEWGQLVKTLNLTPEKASEFQAIGAKYSQIRQSLIEKLKKNESDLEQAVNSPKPDMAKIDELVPMIIADHNQLFESFKAQRQEEMAILDPLQRAKYLLALKKWHDENRESPKPGK
jgi:Spy/CpxP family protein refolding chaperone